MKKGEIQMTLDTILKQLSESTFEARADLVESVQIKNYGSNMLSETDMWIIRQAAENAEYLEQKIKEAEELSLDTEAPSENDELSLDTPSDGEELTLDSPSDSGEELTLDTSSETEGSELSLDDSPSDVDGDELTLDDDTEKEEKKEIETSLEGVGILPLLAEIQEKIATGKPSEIELAALKAMKKMF